MARLSVSGEANAAGSRWPQLYMGLGFTMLSIWLLGMALAALLRAMYDPGFARAALTLALFGFPVGGFFSEAIARRRGELSAELGRLSFVNAVTVGLLLWFLLTRSGAMTWPTLVVVAAAASVPFFFAGLVAALAYAEGIGRVERMHAATLMGSAAGAVLLWLFLDNFGLPNTVIAAGVTFGVAASFWFNRAGEAQLRASSVLVALLLVMVMIMNGTGHFLQMRAIASDAAWHTSKPSAVLWAALAGLVAAGAWRGRQASRGLLVALPLLGAVSGAAVFGALGWRTALGAALSAALPLLLRGLERRSADSVRLGWSLYAAGCVWGLAVAG